MKKGGFIMKVLREGKSLEPTMVVECKQTFYGDKKTCDSLLEINASDIKRGYITLDEENTIVYYYIICPVCGAKVEVEYRLIPTEIRKLI